MVAEPRFLGYNYSAVIDLQFLVKIPTGNWVECSLPMVSMEQTLAELSDELLIKLVLQNQYRDQRPFWELVNRHRETVWRVCYRFLGNSQDAEDLTQEVFFRAYCALPQFQGKSSFKTWVYRIAINTSQNELRRLARRPQLAETAVEDMAEFLPSSDTPEFVWLEHEKQLTSSKRHSASSDRRTSGFVAQGYR